jgi:hypothetical protein
MGGFFNTLKKYQNLIIRIIAGHFLMIGVLALPAPGILKGYLNRPDCQKTNEPTSQLFT